MTPEVEEQISLKEYAKKYSIEQLSSEDIIKLMLKPYLINEIATAFCITEKEFNNIRKQKGITNINLETIIRDIETLIYYLDSQNKYFSNKIIKKIVDNLIPIFISGLPQKKFYLKELSKINFNREMIMNDMITKKIDKDYRLKNLSYIVINVEKLLENLIEEEKYYLLNFNGKKLYKQLCEEKKNGKIFRKNDLTYDILFELVVIENTADSLIADIYNLNKNEVRYLRKKFGLINKNKIKIATYPETLMYFMENKNNRSKSISNYEYEKAIPYMIENSYKNELDDFPNNKSLDSDIVIDLDDKKVVYHINFSTDKYSVNKKSSTKKCAGRRHNYKAENEKKRIHGKIGEQVALQSEKERLISIGLVDLINDVKLVAQLDEDITFDGLGYYLISFNELREPICIEVKTSYGNNDKPFFISQKEITILKGLQEEYDCKHCFIYYVLINGTDVTIKTISSDDFNLLKLTPVLYKVE